MNNETQFYILLSSMVINTLISLFTPLISAFILILKRIEKSKCCGGELVLTKSKSIANINIKNNDQE
jgi:membrane glycosyltransferase